VGATGVATATADVPASFAALASDPRLGRAIADMGFAEPTPIQRRAVPEALAGRDLVGLAQTGTGKTLAFLLPSLDRLLRRGDGNHRPRLLVVTPVRELAVQVAEHAEQLARHTDLRVATVYGGANMRGQTSALKKGVDVIVATPGRLLDHVRRRNVDLSEVEVLVLDEADRMLDMGFLPDVREILHTLPSARQTLLFGATMPPAIESLSLQFQRDPVLVEVARQLPPEGIEQLLYPVGKHLKVPLLVHLLTHDRSLERVLVFTERRTEADLVSKRLRDAGLEVAAMHGDIRQRDRERSLERLRDGKVQVLVATNVAARGLDVEGISHVVNYDIPQTVDEYIHRIGRTARADAKGTAYTFIAPGDQWMVKRIESALERELPRVEAEGFDYDVPTPSWAQPSPDDVARSLDKPRSAADVSRRLRPR
ncbi:MAG: DEAD/DEAH box helicase, partial [Anaerolineae bacterium]